MLIDETVDNVERFEMAVPSTPSGQTYRAMVYYSQAIVTGNFTLYDYGPETNLEIYGTETPPPVPLEDYKVPTVLLSGDLDQLATPEDVAWLSEQLGDNVVFEKQYHLNHVAFADALDMSFFSEDAVA